MATSNQNWAVTTEMMPARRHGLPVYAGPHLATIDDLERLATLLYRGGCTPPGIDSPAKVAVCILAGLEVGLSPTQALGSIMLAGGKPAIYGDGAMALVRASGLLESIEEIVEGEGGGRTGKCTVKRKGEPERYYQFSYHEAERAGLIERAKGKGPWVTYPDRMLIARARGFAFRDIFADVLRGLVLAEEALDLVRAVESEPTSAPIVTQAEQPALPPASEVQIEMITMAQMQQLSDLKPHVLPGDARTPAEKQAAWIEIIGPYGVNTAKDLTSTQAGELIRRLETMIPFFGTDGQAAS